MNVGAVVSVACTLLSLPIAPAQAAEQAFECPRVSPVDGQTPLAFVDVLHSGTATWGFPDADVMRKENGMTYRMNNHEASNFTKARMECTYAINRRPPTHSVFLDMPGLLLRCESEGPEVPPDWNKMSGRLWCTTRTENPVQR